MNKIILIMSCFVASSAMSIHAQDSLKLRSPEGVTNQFLVLISGAIDEPRDWDSFRNLFAPGAHFYFTRPDAPIGKQVMSLSIEDFIERVGPNYAKDGFLEIALGTHVDEFNGMANVFQSFHAKNLKGSYDKKGINSYQLIWLNNRWWIISCSFVNESEALRIPDKYLH